MLRFNSLTIKDFGPFKGEQTIDFTNGVGYIEGDSGTSFPESYVWVHCNDFSEKKKPVK